jgi:hypothetical protein
MIRFEHIVFGRLIHLYADHANLVYVIDPYGQNPGIARHTASKLMRWAVKIEALEGDRNLFRDLLTRWAVRPKDTLAPGKILRLVTVPLAPMDFDEDDWRSIEDILTSQRAATVPVPDSCIFGENGLAQFPGGVVWIPDEDMLMQLRLLIAAHAGFGGHRGISSTTVAKKNFVWRRSIDKDVNSLCRPAYIVSAPPLPARFRDLSLKLFTLPNQTYSSILIFFFEGTGWLELQPGAERRFFFLRPTFLAPAADAETTARALTDWFSTFGVVGTG